MDNVGTFSICFDVLAHCLHKAVDPLPLAIGKSSFFLLIYSRKGFLFKGYKKFYYFSIQRLQKFYYFSIQRLHKILLLFSSISLELHTRKYLQNFIFKGRIPKISISFLTLPFLSLNLLIVFVYFRIDHF